MSFTFKWPRFSDRFHAEAKEMLHSALNKGNKPPVIADKIEVVELEMGTQPPDLEIKDIGELTKDQFRGIFKLTYDGDAFIVLRTKVQANPLNHRKNDMSDLLGGSSGGILAAHQPLVVPMLLRLSSFKLDCYVLLVVSKQKGCTLVFKTDPLQNVQVSSTFDSIAVIQSFIQREIEEQLREMFREDLPGIIHRLSQRWVAGMTMSTRVEAPYLNKQKQTGVKSQSGVRRAAAPPSLKARSTGSPRSKRGGSVISNRSGDARREESLLSPGFGLRPGLNPLSPLGISPAPSVSRTSLPRPSIAPSMASRSFRSQGTRSATKTTNTSKRTGTKTPLSSDFPFNPESSLPDIENFDPTYGLRPEGLPMKSDFTGFGKLFTPNKGLRELTGERNEEAMGSGEDESDFEGESAYQVVDWDDEGVMYGTENDHAYNPDDVDDYVPSNLNQPDNEADEGVDMETIPAVGGGFITRPRDHRNQATKSPLARDIETTPPAPSSLTQERLKKVGGVPSSYSSRSRRRTGDDRSTQFRSRDRGMSVEDEPEGAYNPYFGDAYKRSYRRFGVGDDGDELEDDGQSNRQDYTTMDGAHRARTAAQPIPSSSSQPWRSPTRSDARLPVSRSPPSGPEAIQYGTSPSRHFQQPHLRVGSYPSDDPDFDPMMGFERPDFQRYHAGGRSPRGIILRNKSVSHVSALSRSNQTLSPFTRSLSHYTIRSGPPKLTPAGGMVSNTTPFPGAGTNTYGKNEKRKARRKRVYRLGGSSNAKKVPAGADEEKIQGGKGKGREKTTPPAEAYPYVYTSPSRKTSQGHYYDESSIAARRRGRPGRERMDSPPSEFSDEDVEHYFRTRRPSEVVHARTTSPQHPNPSLSGANTAIGVVEAAANFHSAQSVAHGSSAPISTAGSATAAQNSDGGGSRKERGPEVVLLMRERTNSHSSSVPGYRRQIRG